MVLSCPKCGSDEVRLSRRKRALRRLLHVFGIYHFRCEDCGHLFRSNIQRLAHAFFAKCPTCHRMDLSRWTREFYSPGFVTRFMLGLGAKPVRCEYCRNNFWSFRAVREKFSKEKRFARSQVVIPVREGTDSQSHSARLTPMP
jgi:predicted nucleic acid-binding Zn ribbon protein